jgi:hypothetical protein
MRYAAERRSLDESIAELREIADGHDEVLAEAAGITAGSWYAWPSTHVGHELVAAGLLIMAGGHDGKPLDLKRWGGGRGWGLSGGRGSARASDNRRVRLYACSQGMTEARRELPGPLLVRSYSRLRTRSAANSTTAFDRSRMVSATTLSKLAGLVIVGLAGQRITTALGESLPGSTSSIVRWSWLMTPLDSGVVE